MKEIDRGPNDPTRLSYWFPLIQAAGLPVPRTEIIKLSEDDARAIWTVMMEREEGRQSHCAELTRLVDAIEHAAFNITSKLTDIPVFLRTDFTSAKHDWERTCYLADRHHTERHVMEIMVFSEMADLMGLPCDVWVVREMLKTEPVFHAFRGMPIVREFRVFIRDGEIEHLQPYWPPDAIRNVNPPRSWRQRLTVMSEALEGEIAILHDLAKRANAAVPGYWSVDLLETFDRGWVLTDMAQGDVSYKWDPNAKA